MTETARILFVDDEENVLKALQRLFRKEPWDIDFASSGNEALLKFAHEGPYDVVVTDHRMPGMTGVELLKALRVRHPQTVRIALSSYTDVDTMLEAINEGWVYKFLVKTCSDQVLRETLRGVVEAVTLRKENRRLVSQLELQNAEIAAIDWLLEELDSQDLDAVGSATADGQLEKEVIKAMPVGVIALDGDGKARMANAEARRLLGAERLADLAEQELAPGLKERQGIICRETALGSPSDAKGVVYVFWEA